MANSLFFRKDVCFTMKINDAFALIVVASALSLIGCSGSHGPPSLTPNFAAVQEIRKTLDVGGSVASAVEEVQIEFGNQFATLRGSFTLNGTAPQNPTLTVNKDVAVCNPAGGPVVDQRVVVGANNSLANVLIFADVPAEWCHETMIGNTDTVDFDQKNCLFLDRIFPMQTSQQLRILNSDTVGHNAAMTPGNRSNPSFNQTIASNGSVLYASGTELKQEKNPFPVTCSVHPWMQSFIIFRSNAYFAVTGEDGAFELPNLPAGVPVKISVWHEASRSVPGSEVSVEPSGVAEGWNRRGTFTVNLEPDSQTDLNIAINSAALSK